MTKEEQKKRNSEHFFEFIQDLPFWINDKKEHLEIYKQEYDRLEIPFCCLNHFIGLPYKKDDNGIQQPHPIYPYEQILYNGLVEKLYKYLWVNKSAGLGLTEFFLRLILYFCTAKKLRDRFENSQICIVVGPRLKLGIDIMRRFKSLFLRIPTSSKVPFLKPFFMEGSAAEVFLNGVNVAAYPSNHLDTMRGQPNVSFVLVDEGDYFPPREQENVLTIPTRYVGKSQTWIAMVSTPKHIGGLFHTIENDPSTPFKKFIFSYEWGMKKYGADLFTPMMIAEAQRHKRQDFLREYCNQYRGFDGNLFSVEFLYQLQQKSNYYEIIPRGIDYGNKIQFESEAELEENQDYSKTEDFSDIMNNLQVFERFALKNPYSKYYRLLGLDTGFGSSTSGVLIGQINLERNKLEIIYENQIKTHSPKGLRDFISYLIKVLKIRKVGIDRSDPGFISDLKEDIELPAFKQLNWRSLKPDIMKQYVYDSDMLINPITFSDDTKREMLYRQVSLFNDDFIRINDQINLTHANLASINVKDSLSYDKSQLPAPDAWDAFTCLTDLVKIEQN